MKITNKILSLVLVFVLLLSVFPFNVVYAVEENTASVQAQQEQTQNTEEFVLPDIVEEAEATERGYIGRVKEEEKDNYTFVFKDSDNTRTMRVYSHPVKYTDENGNIKDITLDIQSRIGGGFETKDNNIKTTFGAKLSEGIRLQHEDVDIKLIPANKNIIPTLSEDNKTVTYALDEKTSLEYSLTYMGFKEDIIVSEYTGQTEYEFLLYTNGLTVQEEMGSFYLADSEGNRKANVGDIIIFTADERNNALGSLSCEEIKPNYAYLLTIHVDAEYLKDEKTVYPIRIDPTLEITSATTEGAIEDVTVYTGTSYYSGTSGVLYLGTSNNLKYRIMMRFPNLNLTGLTAAQITNATVEFRDLMCQSVQVAMQCRYFTGGATAWSESGTTTWSSIGGDTYVGSLIDTKTIYYGNGNEGSDIQRYSFNITAAAKAWANGTYSPQQGFIFKAADESFSSTEDRLKYFGSYNRSDYRTSFTLQYTENSGSATPTPTNTITITGIPTGVMIKETSKALSVSLTGNGNLIWSSSNSRVAHVANNVLYATGCGATTITASYGTASYSFLVGVKDVTDKPHNFTSDSQPIYIRNIKSGKYIDVENQNFTNKAKLCLWEDSNSHSASQTFRLKYIGEGYYVILPHNNTTFVVSVENSSISNWAYLELQELSLEARLKEAYPDNALWKIQLIDGIYTLQSRCSDKYIDCYNGNVGNGTKLIQYSLNYNSDSDLNLNFGWAFESTVRKDYRSWHDFWPVSVGTITYYSTSVYTEALSAAVAAWNNVFNDSVEQGTATLHNIKISDVNKSDVTWAGLTNSANHTITLNSHYLQGYSFDKKQNTIMHEMGHAFGLAHNPCDTDELNDNNDTFHQGDLMYPYVTRIITLSRDDKYSFDGTYYED